ncbi:MAG: hypothetical protein PHW65_03490, partial [Dehalococcoidales bacterium]|nr:hypothetical protein [Dehalococcoidales bacterium]
MVIRSGTGADAADYIFYTADATAESVQWLMKDCMTNIKKGNDALEAINLISWDAAGDVVMLMGEIDGDYFVFRSYDEGNSFAYWRTLPVDTVGAPVDWVVVDNNTISVAGATGYWGTRAIGTEIKVDFRIDFADLFGGYAGKANVSIARYGDDIAIGNNKGYVYRSFDAGKTWPDWCFANFGGSEKETYVAFGPDGILYAASGHDKAVVSVTADKDENDKDILVTDGENPVASDGKTLSLKAATGIWVSPDNTLYVMGTASDVISGTKIARAEDAPENGTITLTASGSGTPPSASYRLESGRAAKNGSDDVEFFTSDIYDIVGTFEADLDLVVISADVKAVSSSRASGTILVKQMKAGKEIARGKIDIQVDDFTNPFAAFDTYYPVDLSVSFSATTWDTSDPPAKETYGVRVAPSDSGKAALFRLLIGEQDNVWEQKQQSGRGLWGTTGSNLLWTIEGNGIAALEDFNSGKVQNVAVKEVSNDATKEFKTLEVSWKALPCTSCYQIYVYTGKTLVKKVTVTNVLPDAKKPAEFYEAGTTLTHKLADMKFNTAYDVQVRACVGGRLQSRLSDKVSATTECYNVAPDPQVPEQGMQNASLAPSFVWAAPTAGCAPKSYDFQLSLDPNFGSFIIDTNVTGTGYTYTARDLAYDTNHYWRVRSVATDGTKSAWTTVQNFHTMVEPVEPTQAPDITLTVTQNPAPVVTVSIPPQQTV